MERSEAEALESVVLAISTFRTAEHVLTLLRSVFANGKTPFLAVVVVDSLGDGRLATAIGENGWAVEYHNADRNLGSAGNLQKRLQIAADLGGRWCYAINHDGEVDLRAVQAMVRAGNAGERIGAVYPNRFRPNRGGSWEKPRRSAVPQLFSPRLSSQLAVGEEVVWSSSNGALYSLQPQREGVEVWSDLWMSWEDLGYGLCLKKGKWRQIVCADATFVDTYEYRKASFLGKTIYVADKPTWYQYYHFRNLILIAKRIDGGFNLYLSLFPMLLKDLAAIVLYKSEPLTRLRLLFSGALDGIRNISGKGPLP
ncbi:hypothetical protein NKH70_29365 [Mesorhizobium sp. M0991]|uniref:glycosyltransferase family 2 protein n=1 Tax=Mesorhizobium sp. M0991 TaxID=2957043 RepID=UPI003338C7B4